jgi:uncharacterized membrane protein affecting hemolysin expression
MSEWIIKKGNTDVHDIAIYDKNGILITNLAAATAIKFQIKSLETNVALISKTVGAGIAVNTPSVGYLRITLSATDTALPPKIYYVGLQIEWAAGVIREVFLEVDDIETERLKIIQDIVNI